MIHRTSLFWMTGILLFSAVVFALPLAATGYVLAIAILLSPAVWVLGAIYASGGRQAFFRGGALCGILPLLAALGFALALVGSGFFPPIYRPVPQNIGYPSGVVPPVRTNRPPPELDYLATIRLRLVLAGLCLTPQVVACVGGGVSYLTYRLLAPKSSNSNRRDAAAFRTKNANRHLSPLIDATASSAEINDD